MCYIATVYSNSTHEREYEFNSRSAINAANLYGRCESGEVVTVRTMSGREISRAIWTPENGGRYLRVAVW